MGQVELSLGDRVDGALRRSPYLSAGSLCCEAQQGRVVLRGTVGSYFQKQMAQEAIRRVDGVHEIFNELEVLAFSAACAAMSP
jgi:osmotically-inducible protein OsmY